MTDDEKAAVARLKEHAYAKNTMFKGQAIVQTADLRLVLAALQRETARADETLAERDALFEEYNTL